MSFAIENAPRGAESDVGDVAEPCRDLMIDFLKVAEPLQVHLRVKPVTGNEKRQNVIQCRYIVENNSLFVQTPLGLVHEYKFTKVFDGSATQTELFDGTTLSAVKDFIGGLNVIIFSYGVTNSGKTYTMQGNPAEPGVIPRALDLLFRSISRKMCHDLTLKPQNGSVIKLTHEEIVAEKQMKDEVLRMGNDLNATRSVLMESINASVLKQSVVNESGSSANFSDDSLDNKSLFRSTMDFVDDDRFCVFVSFVEIYNEKVYDLLVPIGVQMRRPLNLQENRSGTLFIKGVREIRVGSVDEALQLLVIGQQNLKVASTRLNYSSSRSHSVYTVKVVRAADTFDASNPQVNQLCFCDLAGSERYANTLNVGERLKEAGLINTSLLVLGRCVTALRRNQMQPKEPPLPVPFRESKLTRIFQGFFTGKGKALMIVNISPCENVINETYHVLRFCALAKEIILPQNLDCLSNLSKVTKLSLELIRQSMDGKESIDWESPRAAGRKSSSDYCCGLPDAKPDTLFEEDNESEESDAENIDKDATIQKYLGIIQTLRDKLIENHKEKANIEMQVREDVGNCCLEVLAQQQEYFRNRMEEEKERMEELAGKRIQNTIEYYKTLIADNVDGLRDRIASLEERDNKIKILEAEKIDQNAAMETLKRDSLQLHRDNLQLEAQLKHVSRETQSSLYFSMMNSGSTSSSDGSIQQQAVNATPYANKTVTSTSDDVFKSPVPGEAREMNEDTVHVSSDEGRTVKGEVIEMCSQAQQTDMQVDDINSIECQRYNLEISITDLEAMNFKLECTNRCLKVDKADAKLTIDNLRSKILQLDTKLKEMVMRSDVEASTQTVLTSELVVSSDELKLANDRLTKAEKKIEELSQETKLLEIYNQGSVNEVEKLHAKIAQYEAKQKLYSNEIQLLKGQLTVEQSKCHKLQLELDNLREKSALSKTFITVPDSETEDLDGPSSSRRPMRKVATKKPAYVDDSDSSNADMLLRSRRRPTRNAAAKFVKVEREEEEEEEKAAVEPKLRRTCRVTKTNQMLKCSPRKAKPNVQEQVLRRLRSRK